MNLASKPRLAKPRATYRLERGLYDQPDKSKRLHAATPPVLGPWKDRWPRNRLGLSRWLVDPAHPLTARVTLNRLWQRYFGVGLVKTSENFGVQGELPSHPALLDWLAMEFIRHRWDIKALHRLIVTSATYRQNSSASSTLLKRDPENRLLARGPRKRLTPYAIRDAALFTSDLLTGKLGGPSVKPYMPPGIWASISNARYKRAKGNIDTSSTMANGEEIADIVAFKKMLMDRKHLIVRCLTKKMLTYATGRHLEAVDRGEIDRITAELSKKEDRLRDLIHLVVQSEIFLSK